ncbi:hypothetical protein HYR99_19300 [Candidatus Poribacteria bacterium]|nr:hypothetical protein [Candidatus Poribacteria bacterium]
MSSKLMKSEVITRCLSTLGKYPVLKDFLSIDEVWLNGMYQFSLKLRKNPQKYGIKHESPMYRWIREDSPILNCLEENLKAPLPLKGSTSVKWRNGLVKSGDPLEILSEIELAGLLKKSNLEGIEIDVPVPENGRGIDLKAVLDQRSIFFEVKTLNVPVGSEKQYFFMMLENQLKKRLEKKVVSFGISSSIPDYYFQRNIITQTSHIPNLLNLISEAIKDDSRPVILNYHFDQNKGEFVLGEDYHVVRICFWPIAPNVLRIPDWFQITEGEEEIGKRLKEVREKLYKLTEDEIKKYQPLIAYVDIERLEHVSYDTDSTEELATTKKRMEQVLAKGSSRISALILVYGITTEKNRIHFKRFLCENPQAQVRLTESERQKLEMLLIKAVE